MSDKSAIEWTDATWNVTLGCDKVSQGCRGCYAIPQAWMKQHNPNEKIRTAYEGLVEKRPDGSLNWTGRVNLLPQRLPLPLTWKEPRKIFVTSLSDLFHKDVPDDFIDQVFAVMALASRHTFQVLTKRPERMQEYVIRLRGQLERLIGASRTLGYGLEFERTHLFDWPLPNVWLGTSVEDQAAADARIPYLLKAPAAVRFLSCEPLLGPVDLVRVRYDNIVQIDALRGHHGVLHPLEGRNASISWVIAGGESGPNYRPLDLDWARSLRDQCAEAGVAFSFKQVGGRTPKAGGRLLDGQEWSQFPEVVHAAR